MAREAHVLVVVAVLLLAGFAGGFTVAALSDAETLSVSIGVADGEDVGAATHANNSTTAHPAAATTEPTTGPTAESGTATPDGTATPNTTASTSTTVESTTENSTTEAPSTTTAAPSTTSTTTESSSTTTTSTEAPSTTPTPENTTSSG